MHDDFTFVRKAGNSVNMNQYDPYCELLKSRTLSQRELEIRHLLKEAQMLKEVQLGSSHKEVITPAIRQVGTLLVRVGTRLEKVAAG